MVVGHLLTSPALAGRVQTAQTALHIKDRVREAKATDDLQPILQAIKTRKEVCSCKNKNKKLKNTMMLSSTFSVADGRDRRHSNNEESD